MTFNSYWDRLATVPSLNDGSTIGSFDPINAGGFPASKFLGRSDTVSSFNSTWDEHIISSSRKNDDSFSEHSDDLLSAHGKSGLGASLDIEDDSQMSDGEEYDSDEDTSTECGDDPEYHTECINDINMDSEASVDDVACGLPSLLPSVLSASPPSPSSATSGQYMGLMTRARTRRMEQRHATGDAEPPQTKAKRATTHKNSQQESTYSIIRHAKLKSYYCHACHQINKRKAWMVRHVRDKHTLNPTGR